jgi:hypothetical protein
MILKEESQFKKNLEELALQIKEKKSQISNEQETKQFLIIPFIRALGYNPDIPGEVKFEFPADLEPKKGEKIDIALLKDNRPVIFIEAKPANTILDNFDAQLRKYYHNYHETRFGVITNGEEYRFFSDTQKDNVMDKVPFLVVNFSKLKESDLKNLLKFKKENYHEKNLCNIALDLHYLPAITEAFKELFKKPSDDFIAALFRFALPEKKITPTIQSKLPDIVREAIRNAIMEMTLKGVEGFQSTTIIPQQENFEKLGDQPTLEENEGYYIVKAILHGVADPSRVAIRGFKYNCGILLDNSQNRPICRICFREKEKYVIVYDNLEKKENKFKIENINDLFKFGDHFKKTVMFYDKK